MFTRLIMAVSLICLLLAACTDDDATDTTATSDEKFALLSDDSWNIQEAVDLSPDDPIALLDHPVLDWYVEYVTSDHTEMIRLSGSATSFEQSRSELEAIGFEFAEVEISSQEQSLEGRHPGDPASPALLLVKTGERSLVALSYEVDGPGLAEFMQRVHRVGRDAWLAAGGVIR